MLHQRHLICQRCGREQWAAGRVIEDAERELSYRWCRQCLDEYGPCATPVAPVVQGDALGIKSFFGGLAEHLKAEIAGQVAAKPFAVGDAVIYHGSKGDHWGPARVVEDRGRMVLVRTGRGHVECNWTSLEPIHADFGGVRCELPY